MQTTEAQELRLLRIRKLAGRWWRRPLISALGRQRLADLCEFKANLFYKR
ncbi:hypothetical protein ACRRTK_013759 [Alexandromys fortis]